MLRIKCHCGLHQPYVVCNDWTSARTKEELQSCGNQCPNNVSNSNNRCRRNEILAVFSEAIDIAIRYVLRILRHPLVTKQIVCRKMISFHFDKVCPRYLSVSLAVQVPQAKALALDIWKCLNKVLHSG